jgi:hypothetical protein
MDRPTTQLRLTGSRDIKALLRKPPPAPPIHGTQFTQDGTKVFLPSDSDKGNKPHSTKRRPQPTPLLDVDVSGFVQNPPKPNDRSEDHYKCPKQMDRSDKDYRGRRQGSSRSESWSPPRHRYDHNRAPNSSGDTHRSKDHSTHHCQGAEPRRRPDPASLPWRNSELRIADPNLTMDRAAWDSIEDTVVAAHVSLFDYLLDEGISYEEWDAYTMKRRTYDNKIQWWNSVALKLLRTSEMFFSIG